MNIIPASPTYLSRHTKRLNETCSDNEHDIIIFMGLSYVLDNIYGMCKFYSRLVSVWLVNMVECEKVGREAIN